MFDCYFKELEASRMLVAVCCIIFNWQYGRFTLDIVHHLMVVDTGDEGWRCDDGIVYVANELDERVSTYTYCSNTILGCRAYGSCELCRTKASG